MEENGKPSDALVVMEVLKILQKNSGRALDEEEIKRHFNPLRPTMLQIRKSLVILWDQGIIERESLNEQKFRYLPPVSSFSSDELENALLRLIDGFSGI